MDQMNTPDSWDTNSDGNSNANPGIDDATKGLSVLNVNATPFVPGQNVFAKEFVPSFAPKASETSPANSGSDMKTPSPESLSNSSPNPEDKVEEAPDDWEEKGEETEGGSAPDDRGGGDTPEDSDSDKSPSTEAACAPKKTQKISECSDNGDKPKDHLNIVFIGHVDAGKSTIGGHIMYLTGMVEKRTLEKYEREAKEKNRESWYLSWALDTNLEERDKGKTVEVGRAYFETDSKHFTILDAPGHKSFVPNMIGGASQADVAVLVISARKGEFETGFERGGQTREHAMLVKTAGVKHLVVVVNKMDDHTVNWDQVRYDDIEKKLTPYLKKCGFNPKTDIYYMPVSGYTGCNLKLTDNKVCSWYSGPSLIDYLDSLPPVIRMPTGPVRVPVVDRYRDMGTIVLGKVESGEVNKNQILTLMPNKVNVEVMMLWSDEIETEQVFPGANVKMKLRNLEEDDVQSGFVLCSPNNLCHTGSLFDAQVVILEHKSIICAGYSAVMHIHTCAEEVSIKALICTVDKKTGDKSKVRPRFIKQDQIAIIRLAVTGGLICLETFKDFPQMGRFTLRDEGKTIGIGKVLKVLS